MPFQKIEKLATGRGREAQTNRVTIATTKKQILILMSGDLFAAMGSPRNVSIAVGTGDDAGSLLMTPDPKGYSVRRSSPSARQHRIGIRKRPLGVGEGQRLVSTGHALTDDGLLVRTRLESTTPNGVASTTPEVSRFYDYAG